MKIAFAAIMLGEHGAAAASGETHAARSSRLLLSPSAFRTHARLIFAVGSVRALGRSQVARSPVVHPTVGLVSTFYMISIAIIGNNHGVAVPQYSSGRTTAESMYTRFVSLLFLPPAAASNASKLYFRISIKGSINHTRSACVKCLLLACCSCIIPSVALPFHSFSHSSIMSVSAPLARVCRVLLWQCGSTWRGHTLHLASA